MSFVKQQGAGSCKVLLMGLEVKDPEKTAAGFPSKTHLGNGKFAVQDIDGNTLELAASWPV
jgi:hypothetical protein